MKKIVKRVNLKQFLLAACRAVGTFLFVFCMMETIIILTSGSIGYEFWMMPIFVVPSTFLALTLGAKYWIQDDLVRGWSYLVCSIVSAALLVPISLMSPSYYGTFPMLGLFATFLLPIVTILHGIRIVRKYSTKGINVQAKSTENLIKRTNARLHNAIRFLCSISISCVVLENSHKVLQSFYALSVKLIDEIVFPTTFKIPLSILSAILLARFIKAEFVQRDKPKPEATNQG